MNNDNPVMNMLVNAEDLSEKDKEADSIQRRRNLDMSNHLMRLLEGWGHTYMTKCQLCVVLRNDCLNICEASTSGELVEALFKALAREDEQAMLLPLLDHQRAIRLMILLHMFRRRLRGLNALVGPNGDGADRIPLSRGFLGKMNDDRKVSEAVGMCMSLKDGLDAYSFWQIDQLMKTLILKMMQIAGAKPALTSDLET